ncbi:MAG TPA: VanZ family protein [Vicinamibacterales bacterium]|nr:VanZ family protein [Vicinamibacterales bacterium]
MSVDRPLDVRGWCAVLAALTAAFAAYISLVPFNFTRPPDATLVEAFRRSLEADLVSRSNFAGNVLLFGPLGFFGGGAVFNAAQRRPRHLLGAVALVALSITLSFSIEFLQVLVPGRTPSLADVTAQTAGMLAGLGAWLLVSGDILRWAERRGSDRRRDALYLGLMVFAAGRAMAMLLPLDVTLDLGLLAEKYRNGLIVLNPMGSPALSWDGLPARLADLAFSIPIGVLACLAGMPPGRRRHAGLALLLGWAFAGFVEAAQVFVVSRTADVVDWFVNATGIAAGVWLTTRFLPGRVGQAPAPSSWIPMGGLVVSLAFYVLYNWSPFDFRLSGELIGPRIPMIFGAPFYGYYQNPETKAVDDLLVKIALGVPIGMFLSWWISSSPAGCRRLAVATASVLTAIFFAVVEAGQILLPTRYPDNTDILLGLAGVLVGSWVVRAFGPSRSS